MESIECSVCHRTFGDETLLLLHHEYEPCFNSSSSASSSSSKVSLICPICDKVYFDPLVLQIHINEDHEHDDGSVQTTASTTTSDQLYAQELDRRERMRQQYQQQNTASAIVYDDSIESEDAQIARLLQEEENAQSFQEFQVGIQIE